MKAHVSTYNDKPTPQQIREHAYSIYLAEGCPNGRHDEHWVKAMEQLREAMQQAEPPPVSPIPAVSSRRRKA